MNSNALIRTKRVQSASILHPGRQLGTLNVDYKRNTWRIYLQIAGIIFPLICGQFYYLPLIRYHLQKKYIFLFKKLTQNSASEKYVSVKISLFLSKSILQVVQLIFSVHIPFKLFNLLYWMFIKKQNLIQLTFVSYILTFEDSALRGNHRPWRQLWIRTVQKSQQTLQSVPSRPVTWSQTASNETTSPPRDHTPSDVRNDFG